MILGDHNLDVLARRLAQALVARGWRLATAESCTGGFIAKVLTDVAGSSTWFEGGVVTYSNALKMALLGVSREVLAAHGAVSEPVVCAMAEQARARFATELAVAVSGVAGPTGGTADKPVGTVWVAWATPSGTRALHRQFPGDRAAVRRQSVAVALEGLIDAAERPSR